jgi:hypothetical protein
MHDCVAEFRNGTHAFFIKVQKFPEAARTMEVGAHQVGRRAWSYATVLSEEARRLHSDKRRGQAADKSESDTDTAPFCARCRLAA